MREVSFTDTVTHSARTVAVGAGALDAAAPQWSPHMSP